jgi:predicted transcriptional regulator
LGPLEIDVMEMMWKLGPSNVRDVVERLERKLAYTTIMTTLDRLYKKGLLERELTDRAFVYQAKLSREEWDRRRAGEMMAGFLAGPEESRHLLLSCLVDAVGTHDAMLLDELEKKIQRKREELAGIDR